MDNTFNKKTDTLPPPPPPHSSPPPQKKTEERERQRMWGEKGYLLVAEHPSTIQVYLRDLSTQTVVRAVTLREKLPTQLANSPSHSSNMYLRDGSAQTIGHAATLRYKLQIKLSISPSHSALTPGRPYIARHLAG